MTIISKILAGTGITIGTPIAAFVAVNMTETNYKDNLFNYSEVCLDNTSEGGKDLTTINPVDILPTEAEMMTMALNNELKITIVEDELNCALFNQLSADGVVQKEYVEKDNTLNGIWVDFNKTGKKYTIESNVAGQFTYGSQNFRSIISVNKSIRDLEKGTFKGRLENIDLGSLTLPSNVLYAIADNSFKLANNSEDSLEDTINKGVKGIGEFNKEDFSFTISIPRNESTDLYEINNQFTFEDYSIVYDEEKDSITLSVENPAIKGESVFGDDAELDVARDAVTGAMDDAVIDDTEGNEKITFGADPAISDMTSDVVIDKDTFSLKDEDGNDIEGKDIYTAMKNVNEALTSDGKVSAEDLEVIVEFNKVVNSEDNTTGINRDDYEAYFKHYFESAQQN